MIEYVLPQVEDAEEIVAFYNRVGGETSYLSFEKDEYPLTVEQQKEALEADSKDDQQFMLLVKEDGEIIALGTMNTSHKIKAKHVTELGIVVQKLSQSKGVGTELMKRLIKWARNEPNITKIRLDTRADNVKAVSLYLRLGFIIEGTLKNETLWNGQYYDLYVMGKMI